MRLPGLQRALARLSWRLRRLYGIVGIKRVRVDGSWRSIGFRRWFLDGRMRRAWRMCVRAAWGSFVAHGNSPSKRGAIRLASVVPSAISMSASTRGRIFVFALRAFTKTTNEIATALHTRRGEFTVVNDRARRTKP